MTHVVRRENDGTFTAVLSHPHRGDIEGLGDTLAEALHDLADNVEAIGI